MHRSQALFGAFTMGRARRAAARNGAVSERRDAGELIFGVCDSARGGAPRPRRQPLPRARTGSSRARQGVMPRTDDPSLSDRYGPAGRVLTMEHAAGEPIQPETRRGRMNPAVGANPLTDRALLPPTDVRASMQDAGRTHPPWPHRRNGWRAATRASACCQTRDRTARVGRPANRRHCGNRSSSTRSPDSSRRVGLARMAGG
jgi:hypothetical protein